MVYETILVEQRGAVAADAFANGADLFTVGPVADAGFRIRRDIARGDHARQPQLRREDIASAAAVTLR